MICLLTQLRRRGQFAEMISLLGVRYNSEEETIVRIASASASGPTGAQLVLY